MMRAPVWSLTFAGVATAEMAAAQDDVFGVYISVCVGAPDTVVVPDTCPFSAAGARAFHDFDPAVDGPRVGSDCASGAHAGAALVARPDGHRAGQRCAEAHGDVIVATYGAFPIVRRQA